MISIMFGERLSLRRTLILNIIIALCFCITLASTVLIKEFYEHLEENLEKALSQEAKEIIGHINPDFDLYGLDADANRFSGTDGIYRYTVFDNTGQPVVGNESSEDIQAQLLQLALDRPNMITLSGERIGMGIRSNIKGHIIFVLASTYPSVSEKTKLQLLYHEVVEEIIWVLLGIIVIVSSAMLAAKRALTPLKHIVKQAQTIGPSDIDKRLSSARLPAEITPLINAVNGAFDRLEKGYQAQRDFSSNVAHEIRTPMAVLRSSIEAIESPALKESISEDVRCLDRMFEQLIDLSRADALGKTSHEDINLHHLVIDLATDLGTEAIRTGKSLAVTGHTKSHAMGNKGHLTIALSNLIRNALIYSPKGTEVEIEVLTNPAGWKIKDRGAGIEDILKPVLFDRFNRGSATNQSTKGSGIGLAIVKSVADAHGAQVNILDRVGGGSEFVFTFSI
ncbi:MAG: HAMP domain-containing histidine kinase [Amylibacter sp.]